MSRYEGMFLIEGTRANRNWDEVVAHVKEILTRNGAEVVTCEKWAERRLAYEIKHHKRGVYLLIHFDAPGPAIGRIRRECELSEEVLRTLIVVFDVRAQAVQDERAVATKPEKTESAEPVEGGEKPEEKEPVQEKAEKQETAREEQKGEALSEQKESQAEEVPSEETTETLATGEPGAKEEVKEHGESEQGISDRESDS